MELTAHTAATRVAIDHLLDAARSAGLDAIVPTCPGWTVRELVAHLGGVHRWATSHVTGDPSDDYDETAGLTQPDPLGWLAEGGQALVAAIEGAPADLEAMVFLKDPPAPREFWARRQCHETTIHAVDALAASLGRLPRAHETWIGAGLAADGVDELLTGFLTRSRSSLRSAVPVRFGVCPTDVEQAWTVHVSEQPPVVSRSAEDADVVLEAPAASLYLALWNRTDEVDAPGFDLWRRTARVG